MKRWTSPICLLVAGFWLASCSAPSPKPDKSALTEPGSSAVDSDPADKPAVQESQILPIGDSPVAGDLSAPVTLVVFSDFQCPFCKRGAQTVARLQGAYPDQLRVVYKYFPLSMHPQSEKAARAAVAAAKQDKFWAMHDWLFAHQNQFRDHADDFALWVTDAAAQMGLDATRFQTDYESNDTAAQVADDVQLGNDVKVRGTPHFFVNGERFKGAKPFSTFTTIVDRRLEQARQTLGNGGCNADNLYKTLVAENYDKKPQKTANDSKKRLNAKRVASVSVSASDPTAGNTADPLVTFVEFGDFQCPFCERASTTVKRLQKKYGDQVRFVFKQLPLRAHPQAKQAARAALAAHQQGKFWEMHDQLYARQKEFNRHADDFEKWAAGLAKKIGLDVKQFKSDYDSKVVADQIAHDRKVAHKVDAIGIPNFWINGVNLRGAQPYSKFVQVIDAQIKIAKRLNAKLGVSGEQLYKEAVAFNKLKNLRAREKKAPGKNKKTRQVAPGKLTVGQAPTRGPKNAPVTIYIFADFECPFCKRGTRNLDRALKSHKGQVRVVYKHFPLPMHPHAKPAARAAMAAGEQGKFWQMHDKLFAHQKSLGNDGVYEKLARNIGLNISQFKSDMKKASYDKLLRQQIQQGRDVGVRGTPAFFINGQMISGIRSTVKFNEVIEQKLADVK